ncbi:MAG: hypothetical protein PHE31_07115, partial [Tissierellia bacterium]|nr:hypothetical protein [Tissierellia bacterium]
KYIEDIKSVDAKILDVVDIDSSKKKILEYLNETVPDDVITSLIKEEQYMTFIREGCGKIIKSL